MSRPSSVRCHRGSDPAHANHGRRTRRSRRCSRQQVIPSPMPATRSASVRLRFWVMVGTLVIMAVWTITTATYFAFREDVLTRLIGRQAEMQYGYEDRIAELRAQVDRISSRQLLDQEQYEQKLDQILRRQVALESRTSALGGLGERDRVDQAARASASEPARSSPQADADQRQGSSLSTTVARRRSIARCQPGRQRDAGGVGGMIVRLRLRWIGSSSARWRRSTRSRTATIRRRRRIRGACLPISASTPARSRARGRLGGPLVPANSRARRRVRTATLSHQCRPRPDRPLTAYFSRPAGTQAARWRRRHLVGFRRAHGPVHWLAGNAYRPRFARRSRESRFGPPPTAP